MRYSEKLFEVKDFKNKMILPFLVNRQITDSEYICKITIEDSLNSYEYGKSINGALTIKELDVLLAMLNIYNYSGNKKIAKEYGINFSAREILLNLKKKYTLKNVQELQYIFETLQESVIEGKTILDRYSWCRTDKDYKYNITINNDIFEYYYLKIYKKIDYNKYLNLAEDLSGKLYIYLLYNPVLEEYNKVELVEDMLITLKEFSLVENALYELRWNRIIENFHISKDYIIVEKFT